MANEFGLTQEGLKAALDIKSRYAENLPICVPTDDPGDEEQILLPEFLLNHDLDLSAIEDPLPLAMLSMRDPESPMSVAAIARLSPLGRSNKLINGIVRIVGESSKHPLVRECVSLVTDKDFDPGAISNIRKHAGDFIVKSRQQYTLALRQNLQGLLDGDQSPREFVHTFFELTEAGNLRTDIRKRLILSMLLSENVRPSVKFLVLENFYRMPKPVRIAIISGVLQADPSHHIDLVKEEIRWIVAQEDI